MFSAKVWVSPSERYALVPDEKVSSCVVDMDLFLFLSKLTSSPTHIEIDHMVERGLKIASCLFVGCKTRRRHGKWQWCWCKRTRERCKENACVILVSLTVNPSTTIEKPCALVHQFPSSGVQFLCIPSCWSCSSGKRDLLAFEMMMCLSSNVV
jgi:hypothetical protein